MKSVDKLLSYNRKLYAGESCEDVEARVAVHSSIVEWASVQRCRQYYQTMLRLVDDLLGFYVRLIRLDRGVNAFANAFCINAFDIRRDDRILAEIVFVQKAISTTFQIVVALV